MMAVATSRNPFRMGSPSMQTNFVLTLTGRSLREAA